MKEIKTAVRTVKEITAFCDKCKKQLYTETAELDSKYIPTRTVYSRSFMVNGKIFNAELCTDCNEKYNLELTALFDKFGFKEDRKGVEDI